MLDIQFIRDNPEKVKKGLTAKQFDSSLVDKVLELDGKRRDLIQEIEDLRAQRNEISSKEHAVNDKGKQLKEKLKNLEPELKKIEEKYKQILGKIPNVPADDVKVGRDESENEVIRKWGTPIKFNFRPKDHLEIGENLRIIDVKKASGISGARFNYLIGDAVFLEFALVNYVLDTLTNEKILKNIANKLKLNYNSKPFIPVIPPVMIKPDVFEKMARKDPEEERYKLRDDELFLVGSAEHTLGPLHMDETLTEDNFPLRYIGFSTSFRREAGSYGKDTRGILRMHQFDKVEMESFTLPENGRLEQDFFVAIQEYLMQMLKIPYQVVGICTGDMGGPDYRQIDIDSWMPGQNKYRETHTSDYMTDYQSRRLNTKVRRKDATEFVHMNDATAFAIGRTIIAILENYQQKDGSVVIPEVLRKWMGKEKIVNIKI
ncbi:serine--tRNA ligase [Candidatus Woesebacteria bacterium RIFCSPHIGHO2_02_FULL_38_9]|uniref:Serine--tRNA ligase n=1 Tax=Candidatus Woesebacteria bacterium RIFCSPHIGHO2_01_FULL_39_28 TaxID=1802496 RepID=A0A1F7YGX6_9BACT|nr:MAG: serine--tRNA ligase [Candidatus Woesebacteria bacterium RIFCSPHIGHO2_01_FULL_39_28]OGM32586.1 MAG: serine--tRNA ligase [Candidatus Woesebacteria bacterium RIFCSPHIGHO2_02_FULL_38_9]OGM58714.1 MAG: serine--tRNA ligase [Candidatus Woesebacteria bacterium RIFCSPLOWO2_01_FULL_38_20]